jgi:hypothetical protein
VLSLLLPWRLGVVSPLFNRTLCRVPLHKMDLEKKNTNQKEYLLFK